MRPLIAALFFALLLAGCFGQAPPLPRDHYYRILVPQQSGDGTGPILAGVVSVPPLDADGLLRERPLLFSASAFVGYGTVRRHAWTGKGLVTPTCRDR